jgi:hypothetical protein
MIINYILIHLKEYILKHGKPFRMLTPIYII